VDAEKASEDQFLMAGYEEAMAPVKGDEESRDSNTATDLLHAPVFVRYHMRMYTYD
jgi:hypothetical protein